MADGSSDRSAGHLVDLTDAVAALRSQLSTAISAERPQFNIIEFQVEFSVEATAGADGNVKFYVTAASADNEAGKSASHRLTIKLRPREDSGHPVRITRGWDEGEKP